MTDEIQFFCNSCGASLSARAKSAGRFCDCPQCRQVAPIPVSIEHPAPAYPPDLLGIEFRFRCHCCGRKLRVDARNQGEAFDCPACSQRTKVPSWSGPLPPPETAKRHHPNELLVRLSAEECRFLSNPIVDGGDARRSA